MKRLIMLLSVMWIFMGMECGPYPFHFPLPGENFQRNPNLHLFMSPHPGVGFFQPIFSPSEDKVFFIKSDTLQDGLSYVLTSSKDTIYDLVDDSVITYAVSHDGNEIIYVKGGEIGRHWGYFEPTGEQTLVRIDANTGNTIDEIDITSLYVWHIEYTSNDSSVIFSGSDTADFNSFFSDTVNIYSLNLYTKRESLMISHTPTTFTLINDSIFYDFDLYYPQVNPVSPHQIIRLGDCPLNDEFDEDIILVNLFSQTITCLNAKPYYWTAIPYASWSPDGNKIVFSAAKPQEGGIHHDAERFEIWILNLS